MTENAGQIDRLAARNDFFHLSRCRDLLCDVREHHFTIIELTRCIDDVRLDDAWGRFEEPNPYAFKADDGYAFWYRKPRLLTPAGC